MSCSRVRFQTQGRLSIKDPRKSGMKMSGFCCTYAGLNASDKQTSFASPFVQVTLSFLATHSAVRLSPGNTDIVYLPSL